MSCHTSIILVSVNILSIEICIIITKGKVTSNLKCLMTLRDHSYHCNPCDIFSSMCSQVKYKSCRQSVFWLKRLAVSRQLNNLHITKSRNIEYVLAWNDLWHFTWIKETLIIHFRYPSIYLFNIKTKNRIWLLYYNFQSWTAERL